MRRAWRIGAWTLGTVLTLVVALVAAVLIAGNTGRGRALIERATAQLSGGHVRIAGLAGGFPAEIDVQQLQLADTHGVWLTAQGVSLHWSPLALLARHLEVQRLVVARLAIERRPATEPSGEQGGTRIPHIDIGQLSLERLELGPELAGIRATLSVQGTARVRSLSDMAVYLTARRLDAEGNYQLDLRSDSTRVDAEVRLEEPAGGTLANLLQLPGLGALSVDARLSGPRRTERLDLTARAGEARAEAHGSLDLTREDADLLYRLDAPAMRPRADLSWQRIALGGRWQGTLASAHAAAQLRIERLELPGAAGVETLSGDLSADRGDLTVHATAAGLELPGPQPRLLADSPLRVVATMRLNESSRPLQATAEHRLFSLRAEAITAGEPSATFDLRLSDLAPLAAAAGEKLRGKAELKGTLRQKGTTTRLELDAETEIADHATLLTAMLAGPSHLQLAVRMTPQTLEVEHLALNARALTASASGSAQRSETGSLQSLRARYQAALTNLSVLSPTLGGTLKLDGKAEGPIRSLGGQLQLTSSLSLRGSAPETIEASIKARGLPSNASATVQAAGHLGGAPLQLDASLERVADNVFHVSVRHGSWKSARLEGDLTTGADLTPGHGLLRVRMDRLEDLDTLLGTAVKGSISASLALRPARHGTSTELQLDARDLVLASVPANARLSASGPWDALALQLSVQSPDLRGAPGSLETAAQLDLASRKLRLTRVEARYRDQTVKLLAPSVVAFGEGVTVSQLKLGVQNAVLAIDGRVSPELDLEASAHHIEAALINAFAPGLLAQGTIDLDARLKGTPAAPSGQVTLNGAALRPGSRVARDLPGLDVRVSARLAGEAAHLDGHLSAGRASELTLTGDAPLNTSGSLDLRLSGKLDMGLVNPLLEARGERASGALAINATVTGRSSAPQVAGTVDLTNGDLRDYVQGAHLSGMTAHLVASQDAMRIESLKARAGPGEIAISGTVGVLQPKLPVTLHLTARNAQPITSDILNVNLNADVKADGNLSERLDLSGTIDLNRTVVGIPNALPPEVAVLDVRRPGEAPPPPPERKLVIGLGLRLHAPREILVQGRGLNAELGGDLRIGGTTANPSVSGGFDMIRGTFALASTQLAFTKGRVSFNGEGLKSKIDPTLDFTAQATVTDSTVTLHITGLADSPQFELSSTPPLPQDEILARLLFGESASQLTVLQLAQVGAALASLSGVGGSGPNPLARVQKALGLDRLSVSGGSSTGPQQSSGTTVEAGRYVSNRVFVGAKESTTGFSQLEVDVDLSKHLKLQTRLGNGTATTQGITPENDPGSSVGAVYQFEY
jgi:translocation and assembly module TamB